MIRRQQTGSFHSPVPGLAYYNGDDKPYEVTDHRKHTTDDQDGGVSVPQAVVE